MESYQLFESTSPGVSGKNQFNVRDYTFFLEHRHDRDVVAHHSPGQLGRQQKETT